MHPRLQPKTLLLLGPGQFLARLIRHVLQEAPIGELLFEIGVFEMTFAKAANGKTWSEKKVVDKHRVVF